MVAWPEWWSWELELSQHLLKRMIDRGFNEVDLRQMLEEATGYSASYEEGRFAIETQHGSHPWIVVVEPLAAEGVLLVVTAYLVD